MRKTPEDVHALRKAREVVYAQPKKGKLTLVMHKAFNLMLKNAMTSGVSQVWYEIPLQKLARNIDFNSRDMAYLEETLDRMQTTLVKWEVRENATNRLTRTSVQLVGQVQLVGEYSASGTCVQKTLRYRFDEDIKALLLEPEAWAIVDTSLQNRFRSRIALAFYEQLMFVLNNVPAHSDGWTYTEQLPWEEWRDLLAGDDSADSQHYSQYKYFNRDLLMRALTEIKRTVTDVDIEVLHTKNGRFVTHVQVRIRFSAQHSLELEDTTPPIDTSEIAARLQALKLSEQDVTALLRKHAIEDLEGAASYTEARVRRTELEPLNSIPAYFKSALQRRYHEATLPSTPTISAKALTVVPASSPNEQPSRIKQGEALFRELTLSEQNRYLESFLEREASEYLKAEFRKKRMDSGLFSKSFYGWLYSERTLP